MAEIAIPMMALGSLYIMSNRKKEPEASNDCEYENFVNRGTTQLPGTNPIPKNYPVDTGKIPVSNPRKFQGGSTRDEFFKKGSVTANVNTNSQNTFLSMTGKTMKAEELEHNNMVPFFGSKVTQNTGGYNGRESILDSYSGSGSQIIHKREQAPLFKPQKNMSHANGAPSYTDFLQSRVNPGMRMANVKPWQEIKVAPGLNKGFSSKGSGGFNSGMDSRNDWQPKTVDELRTATNPKVTYEGVVLGANAGPGRYNRGIIGKVEKHRPDGFFINSADRWLTTTGAEKAQRVNPEIVMKAENRATRTKEYFGTGGPEGSATYKDSQYNYPKRPQLDADIKYMGGAAATNRWNIKDGKIGDYGRDGYVALPNSRSIIGERNEMGIVTSAIKALTAPVLDALKSTRKEEIVGITRHNGNAKSIVNNGVVYNPSQRTKTTIREQTENTKYTLQGGYNHGGGYATSEHQAVFNQRDSTSVSYMTGSSAPAYATAPTEYSAARNANLNPNKQELIKVDRIRQGNHNLFNSNQNITTYKQGTAGTAPAQPTPSFPKLSGNMSTYGKLNGKHTRERAIDCQRMSGDILSAFKSNPYAQSLHSAV